jgi:hypothetical protein
MADIRIKDLTTTASTTAADDFFAADGATNGTRKLSAYSPTFGGNATVGGSLTVSGTTTADGLATSGFFGGSKRVIAGYNTSSDYGFVASVDTGIGWKELHLNPVGGVVKVPNTAASTSTSSGALVVGNGTSGGLGVGGSIYAGGVINTTSGTAPQLSITPSGGRPIRMDGTLGFISIQGNSGGWATGVKFLGSAGTILGGIWGGGDNDTWGGIAIGGGNFVSYYADFTSDRVKVYPTTASTGTSSGALVVSGGVGVAKRIFTGEGLDTAGDNATHISLVRNGTISIGPTSAATPKLQVGGGLLLANTSQSVPAYGDVGPQLSVAGAVITDTSSSGTVSRAVVNSIAASALAASSTTTYTAAASLFVAGAPTANTNVTITNAYAIYTAGGRINFQGLPTSSAGLQAGTLWNDGGTLKIA